MQYHPKKFLKMALPVALFALPISSVLAQDLEIVGQDGRAVDVNALIDQTLVDDKSASPAAGLPAVAGFGAGQGGVRVIGPDGEPMMLSTEGARSVVMNRSFTTTIENGNRVSKSGGKVIIVDADGQRKEYQLAEETDGGNAVAAEMISPEAAPAVKKSYMIGIAAEPASELVRSQLGLGQDTGLVVRQVQDGSPANAAGLKQFDIILYADDQAVSTVQELTAAVQEAGQKETPISLSIVRAGDEQSVTITPVEREVPAMMGFNGLGPQQFQMEDFGPGILVGGDANPGVARMREMMQRQMQEMQKEMQNLDMNLEQMMPFDAADRDTIR